jgi:hypothetical protein
VKTLVSCAAAGLLALGLSACVNGAPPSQSRSSSDGGARRTLTDADVATAVAAARREVAGEDATVTGATVTTRSGTLPESNTGFACRSGRILNVKLIGTFPHTVTTGHPVDTTGTGTLEDFTVHAVLLAVDASSGRVCRIGVQTGDVHPAPRATVLHLD